MPISIDGLITLPLYKGARGYGTFRTPANIAEMIGHCSTHGHIWIRSLCNDAREVKVNGRVRTWKRDATRVEVPFKYGLYEYGTLTAGDLCNVLIPVTEVGQ